MKKTEASPRMKMSKKFFLFVALSVVLFSIYSSYVYAGNNRMEQSQRHVYEDEEEEEGYEDEEEGYKDEDEGYEDEEKYEGEDDDYNSFIEPAPAQQNEKAVPDANELNPSAQNMEAQNPIPSGKAVHLQLSGLTESIQVTPIIHNGETLIAAEKVFKYMNIPFVKYDKGTLLEIYSEGYHLIFHTNKKVIYKNGNKLSIPAEPIVEKGIYYVPISVLVNGLGYKMEWDPQTETILVRKGG